MSVAERVREVLTTSWFTSMALQYCGKDYGSEETNQYFFYRTVYKMTAEQALKEVRSSRRAWRNSLPK